MRRKVNIAQPPRTDRRTRRSSSRSALQLAAIAPGRRGRAAVSVRGFGGAHALGAPTSALNAPLVGIAANPKGGGYWLLAQDGGIFSYGKAQVLRLDRRDAPQPTGRRHRGDTERARLLARRLRRRHLHRSATRASTAPPARMHLNSPIVGMASTPNGRGYWLVAADGGIFTFGNAHFYGSTGAFPIGSTGRRHRETRSRDTATGLAAADGRIFNFGDARRDARGRRVVEPDRRAARDRRLRAAQRTLARRERRRGVRGRHREVFHGSTRRAASRRPSASRRRRAATATGSRSDRRARRCRRTRAPVAASSTRTASSGSGSSRPTASCRTPTSCRVGTGCPRVGVHQVYSKVPSSPSGNLTLPWTLRFAVSSSGNPIDIHGIPLGPTARRSSPTHCSAHRSRTAASA